MSLVETLQREHLARRQRLWYPVIVKTKEEKIKEPEPVTVPPPVDNLAITIRGSLFKEAIEEISYFPSRRPTIREIQHVVCGYFNLRYVDIISPRRDDQAVQARHAAMWLSKDMTAQSLPQIGRFFGHRDHTTVLHAVRKIEHRRKKDPELACCLEHLKIKANELAARGSIISEVK